MRRQAARRPRDGVREHLSCHPELHLSTHPTSPASTVPRAGDQLAGSGAVLIVPAGVPPGETLSPTCARTRGPPSSRGPVAGSGPAQRRVPTLTVVREFPGRSTSSSSSHVWKLGIGALSAGQHPSGAVGPVWAVTVGPLSTRGQLDRRAHRLPAVHLHSPGCPLGVPMPCARRPGRPGHRAGSGRGVDDESRGQRSVGVRADPAGGVRCTGATVVAPGTGADLPNLCTFLGTTSRPVDAWSASPAGRQAENLRFRRPPACAQLWTATCRPVHDGDPSPG